MKEFEAQKFYNKQFNLFKNEIDLSTPYLPHSEEIIEQVGKPFETVLELGAGNGLLARGLSTFGKNITTIELVPEMVEFAKKFETPNVTSLCGSFYDIELTDKFDVLLYIDGFGVGTDQEQLTLLKRIYQWLNEDGVGLIDIYQPEYWKKTNGQKMKPLGNSTVEREYGYDVMNNQMTDTWWETTNSNEKYTQTLKCYTPDEIYKLCQEANLEIIAYYPGGTMDYENWQFNEVASLSDCLSYRIKVRKAN